MADYVHVFEIINLTVLVQWKCAKQYISFSVIARFYRQLGYSEVIVGMHCQQFKKSLFRGSHGRCYDATIGTTLYDVTDVITQHNVTCSNGTDTERRSTERIPVM